MSNRDTLGFHIVYVADSSLRGVFRALLLIAANLAPHLEPHPAPLAWIKAEEYVWRNWRIYALLAIALCRQPLDKTAIADLIADALLGELISSVGIDRFGQGPQH
jgi:hypothetical protein